MSIGILLCNLGTPIAPDTQSISRFLQEFLSDRRVIDRSGLYWKFLLSAVIIPRRAPKTAAAYQAIWNHDSDESPLRRITRSQATQLADIFRARSSVQVDWAMRYGTPSIAKGIRRLTEAGCDRLLVVPLYPQYSGATTGSLMDAVAGALADMPAPPAIRVLPPHYSDPAYIDAIARRIRQHHDTLGWRPDATALSFHSLPRAFIDRGDPYEAHCDATARHLREALGSDEQKMPIVYQSRGSRGEWIGPALEETLVGMAENGVKRITVATPGFISDCVETLEEVAIRARHSFLAAGGLEFSHIPCLNDTATSIEMIRDLVGREVSGWVFEPDNRSLRNVPRVPPN